MTTCLLNKYSDHIWNIYNENFPSYLKTPKRQFISNLNHYAFWDILFYNSNTNIKHNLNNLTNITQHSGLNKGTTYSNLDFSVFINKSNSESIEHFIVSGFALFNFFSKKNILHLDYLSLAKSMQGKGNGKAYLQYIINQIYKKYSKVFKYLVLECENHLVPFYKSNGFIPIEYNYCYKGIKMNLMVYNDKAIEKMTMITIAKFLSNVFATNSIDYIVDFVLPVPLKIYSNKYLFDMHLKFRFHTVDNFKKN
jgi:GNAT superfamily N-acetyltransferase